MPSFPAAAAGAVLALAGGSLLFPELRQPPPAPAGGFRALAPVAGPECDRRTWRHDRARLLAEWQARIGPFPARVPLEARVLEREELPDHLRIRVDYRIDSGTRADAYLLLPKGFPGRRPGVVVLHQTSDQHFRDAVGLAGRETMHVALHLVRRGYACIAPRNFLWSRPDTGYREITRELLASGRWKTGMARMTWDAIRAADVLADQPAVDPKRIGSIGHSLGAKEALYHAAFDPRVRAAVSSEGGIGLDFSNWDADWYLGAQVRGPGFSADHHELLALIAPRAFLLVGGGSADGAQSWPYLAAALPAWRAFGAEERAGLLLHPFGHDLPPPGAERERIYDWLDHWLRPGSRRRR